jgi:helix-turn-helix protein
LSETEEALADTQGAFVQVITDGRKVADLTWIAGRLLLSDRRLVLASTEGKRTIPLSKVSGLKIREDVGESIPQVPGYISCQVGTDVFLLGPTDFASFQSAFFDALLDDETVLIKHSVLKGGVV